MNFNRIFFCSSINVFTKHCKFHGENNGKIDKNGINRDCQIISRRGGEFVLKRAELAILGLNVPNTALSKKCDITLQK